MRNANEDLALVARCKRELPHQHRAFEQLVSAYKDMIYTLCYRMTGNAADAEDLLQDVLMKLFLSLSKFEGRSAFSSWVYRITYNHCLNFIASRKQALAGNDPLPEGDALADPKSDASPQDERTLATLASIPAEERSLLVMRYVMDLDIQQMSEILEIGISATKMRISRARDRFRSTFEENA